ISNLMDDLGDKNNTSEIRSECQPVKLRDDTLSKHRLSNIMSEKAERFFRRWLLTASPP
ncbi:unnamed protein product, partial [Heterobilharzia americana]